MKPRSALKVAAAPRLWQDTSASCRAWALRSAAVNPPFIHRFRVRYAECDPQGVVFNAHYLAYADIAMTELWRESVAGGYQAMIEAGADMVVAEANLRFRAPARFDDEVDAELTVTRLGTTGMTSAIRLLRDSEPLSEVTLRHVFVATDGSGKVPIPDQVRSGLEVHLVEPAVAPAAP